METSKRENGSIKILIAEEHPFYGDGLRALLEKEPDLKVLGVATDVTTAIGISREQRPDILILNVLEDAKGIGMTILEELHRQNVPVRPLLLTTFLSGRDLKRALLLGARGVVLKTSSTQALFDGIRGVMTGRFWIGAEIGDSMLGALRDSTNSTKGIKAKGAFGLTPRELEIVATVVSGYSNAEIAKKYGISEQTVKHHLSSIFDRLGVFNRLELALFAVNHRLVSQEN